VGEEASVRVFPLSAGGLEGVGWSRTPGLPGVWLWRLAGGAAAPAGPERGVGLLGGGLRGLPRWASRREGVGAPAAVRPPGSWGLPRLPSLVVRAAARAPPPRLLTWGLSAGGCSL